MTSPVQPDTWTPQRWSHADVIAMQARLDPARMIEYADHWRRVLDDARAVFSRLDADVTRHLEESWRGHAGRQALEALRRYISESLDGLTRCRSLVGALAVLSDAAGDLRAAVDGVDHVRDLTEVRVRYSEPAVAAGNAVDEIPAPPALSGASVPALPALPVLSPAATVPASYGAPIPNPGHEAMLPITSSLPLGRNGFDDHGGIVPTHTAGSPPPPSAFVGAMRNPDSPLPAATLNAATLPTTTPPTVPPAAPAQTAANSQPRGGLPYLPLVGAGYPGALTRDDGGSRRRTPGYLITVDNGNEFIGPLPKVAPPVLGDW